MPSGTQFLPRLDIEQVQESTLFFLAEDPSTEGALLDQMAKYFLTTEALIGKILRHPHVEKTTLNYIRLFGAPSDTVLSPSFQRADAEPDVQAQRVSAIEQLKVPEKMKLALNGNREARFLLLRDPNRQVALSVLKSPRLTEEDVETIARARYVSEEIVQMVAKNTAWTKRYAIRMALAGNPKTPFSNALVFLKTLREKDVNHLARDKEVTGAVRAIAVKMIQTRKA